MNLTTKQMALQVAKAVLGWDEYYVRDKNPASAWDADWPFDDYDIEQFTGKIIDAMMEKGFAIDLIGAQGVWACSFVRNDIVETYGGTPIHRTETRFEAVAHAAMTAMAATNRLAREAN